MTPKELAESLQNTIATKEQFEDLLKKMLEMSVDDKCEFLLRLIFLGLFTRVRRV